MLADPRLHHAPRAPVRPAARPAARRAPWMAVLSAVLALAGGHARLVRHSERAWASITFSGARHTIVLAFAGREAIADGERLIAALPDHEFSIPRQIVADAAVLRADHALLPEPRLEVELDLLMLEEC